MGSLVKNITPSCPSNYGPGGDGHPCTSNLTPWTQPSDLTTATILAQHLNELRDAIRREQARRQISQTDFGANVASSNLITAAHWSAIRNAINTLKTFSWSSSVPTTGNIIQAAQANEYRAKINDAEDDCLCHCNYCTCNCNYCTCNCNYCTCNCNYCTCVCNYSCKCNCNYSAYHSDARLKYNILYI